MKRLSELRDLSDDHHSGLVLARRCKQAGRTDSGISFEPIWERVLDAFASHLEPHFQIEEQHLLPALEAIGEDALASRIRDDHRALREFCQSVTISRELIERFGALLESHIRYEEREVFGPTQDRLSAAGLKAIESACQVLPRDRSISLEV